MQKTENRVTDEQLCLDVTYGLHEAIMTLQNSDRTRESIDYVISLLEDIQADCDDLVDRFENK